MDTQFHLEMEDPNPVLQRVIEVIWHFCAVLPLSSADTYGGAMIYLLSQQQFLAWPLFVLALNQVQKEISEYVLIPWHLSIPCTNVKIPILRSI